MSSLLLASLLLPIVAPHRAIQLNVNVAANDVIVGERSFKVTVIAPDAVTQVEFYVGTERRDQDTSTPYEFRFDSLNENDGPLTLKFKAYTSTGETGEKTVTVNVDNGTSKGVDFHIQAAESALTESKWDNALTEGRIALKIDPKSNAARRVMARANLKKGIYDKAQQYAEDAVAQDPKDLRSLDLLSSIQLTRAFNTVNTGGERSETLTVIREALKSAVGSRVKVLNMQIDELGAATDANLLQFADANIVAARYSIASSALQPAFNKDQRRNDLANRLAYCQLRLGRLNDALATLNTLKKFGTLDAYGFALVGVVQVGLGNDQASDDAIREAVLADGEDVGVRTAQAFIALKRNRTTVLSKLSDDLAKDNSQRTEVNYFLSALANRQSRYSDGEKFFERAVLAEPTNYDAYIEQGNESIAIAQRSKLDSKEQEQQLNSARAMFEAALQAKDNSFEALTGLSIVYQMSKAPADALKYAQAAVGAAPTVALAHYTLSSAYSSLHKPGDAQTESLKAGKLDVKNLGGRELPNAAAVFRYFNTAGRSPVISAPK